MNNFGYIKIYRKILDNFIYLDSQAVHLWLHILLKANHSKKEFLFNGKKETLKIGQLILSRDKLSLETNINPSKIYRLLKILEREQLIEQQTNNHFTKITVLNYEKYQNKTYKSEQRNEQPVNNQRTTSEQPVNTNNNDKNDNNDNNVNNKPPTPFKKEFDLSFIENKEIEIIFKKWLDYKKERGQSYKPIGLKTAYKKLIDYSGGDFKKAKEIIDSAISNNYAGFFPLREDFNKSKGVQVADNKYDNLEVIDASTKK